MYEIMILILILICSLYITAITMASVRLELAKEDQVDLQTGTSLALHKDCTPSVLISTGLELEEQQ
jgi:hypothetical protein